MKKSFVAIVAAGMLTVSAITGAAVSAEGAGQPGDNASCMGVERATRNSNGGDRAQGGFGPAQAAQVQTSAPYGQWLEDEGWKAKDGGCPQG